MKKHRKHNSTWKTETSKHKTRYVKILRINAARDRNDLYEYGHTVYHPDINFWTTYQVDTIPEQDMDKEKFKIFQEVDWYLLHNVDIRKTNPCQVFATKGNSDDVYTGYGTFYAFGMSGRISEFTFENYTWGQIVAETLRLYQEEMDICNGKVPQ